MSKEYEGQNPIDIAKRAEQDLNTNVLKAGDSNAKSNSAQVREPCVQPCTSIPFPLILCAQESGVDEAVTNKFPGSEVTTGSAASGRGDNRDMPEGGVNPTTGQYVESFEAIPRPSLPYCTKLTASFLLLETLKPATSKASADQRTRRKCSRTTTRGAMM